MYAIHSVPCENLVQSIFVFSRIKHSSTPSDFDFMSMLPPVTASLASRLSSIKTPNVLRIVHSCKHVASPAPLSAPQMTLSSRCPFAAATFPANVASYFSALDYSKSTLLVTYRSTATVTALLPDISLVLISGSFDSK